MSQGLGRLIQGSARWSPLSIPSLRLYLNAAYEAARRGLVAGGRVIEDRFNRADGAIGVTETGQAWTTWAGTPPTIAGNRAIMSANTTTTVANSLVVDQVIRCELGWVSGASTSLGVAFRGIDSANYLRAVLINAGGGDAVELFKVDAGTPTSLVQVLVTIGTTGARRIRIEAIGNSISMYVEGTQIDLDLGGGGLSYTLAGGDATKFGAGASTATFCGLTVGTRSASHYWDDFRVDPPNTTILLDQWSDDGPLGLHALQATQAKRPVLLWDGLRWVVRFNGINNIMVGPPVSSALQGYICWAGTSTSVATTEIVFASGDEGSTTRFVQLRTNSARIDFAQQDTSGAVADVVRGDTVLANFTAYILEAISTGSAYRLRVNGIEQSISVIAGTNGGDWFGDTTLIDSYSLGAGKRTTEVNFAHCDAAALLIADEVPA